MSEPCDSVELPAEVWEAMWRLDAAETNFNQARPLMARQHVLKARRAIADYSEKVVEESPNDSTGDPNE